MSVLAVEGLSLRLDGKTVLDEVSTGFAAGRVTAVLGPNGAGKSTLLACLAGLRPPQSGRVMIDGICRTMLAPRDAARRIGFLPQTADVYWDVDAITLVGLGRTPHRSRWGASPADHLAIERAMTATDVTPFAHRTMTTLSGGERARVLLARVLAGEPEWLLADEPLANLDPAHQLDALDCLRRVAATGAGVVVVLHDLNHALRVADDVLLLRNGRAIASGTAETVLTPALIAETYGIATHMGVTPEGQRFIITTHRDHPCRQSEPSI